VRPVERVLGQGRVEVGPLAGRLDQVPAVRSPARRDLLRRARRPAAPHPRPAWATGWPRSGRPPHRQQPPGRGPRIPPPSPSPSVVGRGPASPRSRRTRADARKLRMSCPTRIGGRAPAHPQPGHGVAGRSGLAGGWPRMTAADLIEGPLQQAAQVSVSGVTSSLPGFASSIRHWVHGSAGRIASRRSSGRTSTRGKPASWGTAQRGGAHHGPRAAVPRVAAMAEGRLANHAPAVVVPAPGRWRGA
jgi:hypothetical protein